MLVKGRLDRGRPCYFAATCLLLAGGSLEWKPSKHFCAFAFVRQVFHYLDIDQTGHISPHELFRPGREIDFSRAGMCQPALVTSGWLAATTRSRASWRLGIWMVTRSSRRRSSDTVAARAGKKSLTSGAGSSFVHLLMANQETENYSE